MSRIATFTVTLSKTSTLPVTVAYTTYNGSPSVGSAWVGATGGVSLDPADFVSASGTLTFAPGETSKTVTVVVRDDIADHAEERFTCVLSAPTNAMLASHSQGVCVLPGETLPVLTLTISPGEIMDAPTAPTLLRLSTKGNQIVDSTGQSVRLRAVNWYGFESADGFPQSWGDTWRNMIDKMSAVGFNCIRLPLSTTTLTMSPASSVVLLNSDLTGLTSLQALDAIIAYGATKGMRFILDHHRVVSGNQGSDYWDGATDSQSGTSFSKAQWISFWSTLATRYASQPAVCGADLHNEPHQFTWSAWKTYVQDCGNAIHLVTPHWLILVEGIGTDAAGVDWWGGGLGWVASAPIILNSTSSTTGLQNKVVYSPHDYAYSVTNQTWLPTTGSPVTGYPTSLASHWTPHWGFIFTTGLAPILLGEFGGSFGRDGNGNIDTTQLNAANEILWINTLVRYLNGDTALNGGSTLTTGQMGMGFAYWAWNPGDAPLYGLLKSDFKTVNANTMILLQPLLMA